MKKFLIISLSIISSLFLVDTAKAETKEFEYRDYTMLTYKSGNGLNIYDLFASSYKEYTSFSETMIDNKISELRNIWNTEYKNEYPYYFISVASMPKVLLAQYSYAPVSIYFFYLKSIPSNYSALDPFISLAFSSESDEANVISSSFDENGLSSSGFAYLSSSYLFITEGNRLGTFYYYMPTFYYGSNFDLPFGLDDTYVVKKGDETLFTLNKEDIVPTYKDKFIDRTDLNYTEVDLNSHPYVVLSLKDYNKTEEFSFNTYVKGQYCLTPVYDYGLREKKDVLSGSKNQRCSPYYDNYTPVRTYVLESDLKNHAVYYLKAQDTTKENKVKIDTNIFNIHYVSEEEKDNPIITINGKKYSITPFDELTDTANKSEDEGYNSGSSCAVGDFNCTRNTLGVKETSWSDIFSSPLEFLKNIWTSITQVFVIITYFIALLPTTLQYFLYISFMLAIILGIIKIIL